MPSPLRATRARPESTSSSATGRHGTGRCSRDWSALGVTVDPSIKDQDLELLLHRQLQKLEADAIAARPDSLRRSRHHDSGDLPRTAE